MFVQKLVPLAAVVAMAGCYAEATPGGIEVTSAPVGVEIESEPSVVFEGHPTYYHEGRWYYRGEGGRWNVYRSEPRGLVVHRERFVRERTRRR